MLLVLLVLLLWLQLLRDCSVRHTQQWCAVLLLLLLLLCRLRCSRVLHHAGHTLWCCFVLTGQLLLQQEGTSRPSIMIFNDWQLLLLLSYLLLRCSSFDRIFNSATVSSSSSSYCRW
jgi:hypothetical protein